MSMDSATYKAELSKAATEVSSAKQALGFAVAEENNTDNPEDKSRLGNKIEQLKGGLEGAAQRHSSAVTDLNMVVAGENRDKVAKETEELRAQQVTIEKEAQAAKKIEKEVDTKDPKSLVAKKDLKLAGNFSEYERTGDDVDAKQAALLKQVEELAKRGSCIVKEPQDDIKDKPAVAANVGAATPVIASTAATGVAQDTPTATSKIQGAAGSSSAST